MKYQFHPEALVEFEEATRYYAAIQAELAQRFIENVEAAINRLSERPSAYAILEQDVRRCLARVFPYAVLYTIEREYALIVAVMRCHRTPGYWHHRIADPA